MEPAQGSLRKDLGAKEVFAVSAGAMISSGPAPIRFNAPRRGNGEVKFGSGEPPKRLPPSIVVSTNMNTPPKAGITNSGQKSTPELTIKERQQVAYVSYATAQ